jgi:hypothetical protein
MMSYYDIIEFKHTINIKLGTKRNISNYIHLPKCSEKRINKILENKDFENIWIKGSEDDISKFVFICIGQREEVIKRTEEELTKPTRGFFITSDTPITTTNTIWPCSVLPEALLCIKSLQITIHFHTILIMPYYSISYKEFKEELLKYNKIKINIGRIKTTWDDCKDYLRKQAIETIEYTASHILCTQFVDITDFKGKNKNKFIESEYYSHGAPFIFGYPRERYPPILPSYPIKNVTCHLNEVDHVHPGDILKVGDRDMGQCFIMHDCPQTRDFICIIIP